MPLLGPERRNGLGVGRTGFPAAHLPTGVPEEPGSGGGGDEQTTQGHAHPSRKPYGLGAGSKHLGKMEREHVLSLPLSLFLSISNLQAEKDKTKVSGRNGCSRGSPGRKIKMSPCKEKA